MDKAKLAAAQKALSFVNPGMSVGLGTGSTAEIFIDLLGKRNKDEKLGIACIATSRASEKQAKRLGLALGGFDTIEKLDAAFDGADAVDSDFNLIKGLGGALVREKIVDYRATRFFVLVGENKLCDELSGIVPVEVVPLAEEAVRRDLAILGASEAPARMDGKKKFLSDNGNALLHAKFGKIEDPAELEWRINEIPGVVDNGLFTKNDAVSVIVGSTNGTARVLE